jgi:hypothetical protein
MRRTGIYRTLMTTAALSISFIATAQQQLSLKHGLYVLQQEACNGAANAAIMSWDGSAFSGPRSSKCSSRVVQKDGQQFQISTSCSALGDGSSNPSGKPYVESLVLTRLSDKLFKIMKGNELQGTYRWCSEKEVH